MAMNDLLKKGSEWVKKYKFAAIIMVIGIVLMCIPAGEAHESVQQETMPKAQQIPVSEQLEGILSQLQGAGKVKVMLTVAQGEKTIFQFDEDADQTDNGYSIRKETVIITDKDRNEQALISQMIPPVYLGAVILCQGADQPAVKLAIVEAVSKITGLGTDKICVLKMK